MSDDLTTIRGIGPAKAEALRDVGFETVEGVMAADPEALAEADGIGTTYAEGIQEDDDDLHGGRPPKIEDDEIYDEIMDAAERGLTFQGIARVAGIGVETLRTYREEYPEFRRELEQRRAVGEKKLVDRVVEEKPEFILERSYGYIKTEKREIEGEHEHTIEGEGFVVEFGDSE